LEEACLERDIRVLVVDDFEPFRDFVSSTLKKLPEVRIIGEVSDGMEAVEKAQELRPDLILLDIGLPALNGIETARRIRELSPRSKILFVSASDSKEMVEAALRLGAHGYVLKSDAQRELIAAVESVVRGEQFVSATLAGRDLGDVAHVGIHNPDSRSQNLRTARHEVGFFSHDGWFLEEVTHFVGKALEAGNAAIVVATESHRNSLLPRFRAYGMDIGRAADQGRYIALDAAEALSTFMVNDVPDPVRFIKTFEDLILSAAKAAQGKNPRVAVFGECAHLLWAQGATEAVIEIEQLGNQLVNEYDVDILCGYSLDRFDGTMDGLIYQRICSEHSTVHAR
jgi:DNA-binding NarL/FixJ family response regulator